MSKFEKRGFTDILVDSLNRSDVLEVVLKNTIVSALITARIERSMNQKEFAAFMGVSQAMVSKWEGGDCNFTVESIAKICEKLGLVPEFKLTSENDYLAISRKNVFTMVSWFHENNSLSSNNQNLVPAA